MREIICTVVLMTMMTGCGFSVRESMIRSQRPEYLKDYKGGPVASLSQKDIEEAIEFGKNNKHNQQVINYAFMFAKDSSTLAMVSRTVYVLVCTNYYLIADYAAKQTRNYEAIDMSYVKFLANLPTFKIEAVEQIGSVFYPLQLDAKFVLLKNGVKVETSQENPVYESKNPYAFSYLSGESSLQEKMNETVKANIEMANKMSEAYQKEMKIDLKNIPQITYGSQLNIYYYKEVDFSSKYELVVIQSNREIHVPIDFLNIK